MKKQLNVRVDTLTRAQITELTGTTGMTEGEVVARGVQMLHSYLQTIDELTDKGRNDPSEGPETILELSELTEDCCALCSVWCWSHEHKASFCRLCNQVLPNNVTFFEIGCGGFTPEWRESDACDSRTLVRKAIREGKTLAEFLQEWSANYEKGLEATLHHVGDQPRNGAKENQSAQCQPDLHLTEFAPPAPLL
mgnify:CR=1 FL=1